MPSLRLPPSFLLPCLVLLVLWARPTHAFGAGNIASTSKIEGQNWRHGDIEDTLLTILMSRATGKKFSKMDVKRVYFGNWLRDYSQAVDVGTVKMVSAEAIRILLWVLGFLSFGYGTKEFEVTRDRLGCYRPEEHIDNPKDYADNLDARQYDRRLRGPVDERRELSIDPRTGLKSYIASEDQGITTSAGLVRNLFGRCIELGRKYNRNGNKADLHEALRLLGTGCHCLEDYSAHSNYVELALIEMGERDVFPHVGRNTQVRVQGARSPIWPLITGTFGGVDFLHSVCGEFSDKATQSEIQELEGTVQDSARKGNKSIIKDLLAQLPDGLFGDKDQAGKAEELEGNAQAAQMQGMSITPKEPEEFTQQMGEIVNQVYPIMEWHDEIMQSISEFIESVPILPDLIEQLQDQINLFVFSLLAPFVLPIISQVKTELETGSSEVIASSKDKQLVVFYDDESTDPTHSMISKDHFSNVLNEPAGKIASQVLKWVVPQIVNCWDDERADASRTIGRIINGVFHHPALRQYGDDGASESRVLMFNVVERWWGELSERAKNDLRDKLSRDGVMNGRNHKEGVHDKGHGCGKPLKMANDFSGAGIGGGLGGVVGDVLSGAGGGGKSSSGYGGGKSGKNEPFHEVGNMASDAVGGGALGGLVGGLVGGIGGSLMSDAFGGGSHGHNDDNKHKPKKEKKYKQEYNEPYGGGHTTQYTETSHQGDRYSQSEYKKTEYEGGRREERNTYQQEGRASGGYGGGYQSQVQTTSYGGGGGGYEEKRRSKNYDDDDEDEQKRRKKERKAREKAEKKSRRHHDSQSEEDEDSDDEYKSYKKKEKRRSKSKSRERESQGYGEERRYGGGGGSYGRGQSYGGDQRETGAYGGGHEIGYEERQSGYEERESRGYGGGRGRDEHQYGGGNQYGRQQEEQEYGGNQYQERSSGYRQERRMPGGFGGDEYSEGRNDNEYDNQYESRRGYSGDY